MSAKEKTAATRPADAETGRDGTRPKVGKAPAKRSASAAKPKPPPSPEKRPSKKAVKERREAPRVAPPSPGPEEAQGFLARMARFFFGRKPPKDLQVSLDSAAQRSKGGPSLLDRLFGRSGKKAKPETDPTDAFGFSLQGEHRHNDPVHQAIAVSIPGLAAGITQLKKAVRVHDISTTGIGLRYDGPRVKSGTMLTLMLATRTQKLLTGLKAEVKRHEKGILGARFVEPDRQQETVLAKLVLEGQKRAKKKGRERELPDDIKKVRL